MVEDAGNDWIESLPAHVKNAYGVGGPTPQPIIAPVFCRILHQLGYPGSDLLYRDLTQGSQTIGTMPNGVGCPLREHPKANCSFD